MEAKYESENCSHTIESPAFEHVEHRIESLQRRRQREIKRRQTQQTQATLDEFIEKADKECQHSVHKMPFASQTYVKFNDWWSQTYPPSKEDAQLQTDTCFHDDKQTQFESSMEHKLVQTIVKGPTRQVKKPKMETIETQTVQSVLGAQVLMFAELRAEQHEERTSRVWKVMDSEKTSARVRLKKTKKNKDNVGTQTDRKETASQLMQAELICHPEEEEVEKVLSCSAHDSAFYTMTKAKAKKGIKL